MCCVGGNENKHKAFVKCHSPIWRSRRGRQGPSQVEVSEALVLATNSKGMLKNIKLKKLKAKPYFNVTEFSKMPKLIKSIHDEISAQPKGCLCRQQGVKEFRNESNTKLLKPAWS